MKPTRFYSKKQEDKVARQVDGKRTPNSEATKFSNQLGGIIDDVFKNAIKGWK